MLRCPLATAEKARKAALTNLELSLDEISTHPDLTSLISLAIGSGETPLCEVAESNIGLQNIMNAQHDIGWGILQYGFVVKAWKISQYNWAKTRDPNFLSKCSDRWAHQLQETLWE